MKQARRFLAVITLTGTCAGTIPIAALGAQQASFVYRLGKDTVGVEQFTRTPDRLTGEVVSRSGPAVVRTQYDAAIGAGGRVTAVTYKIVGADGRPIRGRPVEIRYTVSGDSAKRDVTWADSTRSRMVVAAGAVPFVAPSYGMMELAFAAMRRGSMTSGAFPILGVGTGPALQTVAFTAAGGDTIRQGNGNVFRVDREGRLQAFDGAATTQKLTATRGAGGLNVAALAARMTPTGTLSTRGTARGSFQTQLPGGVIMIDYGRPQVRDRTVWGGLLVPPDTIWRLGANEATHFATSRELAFGDVTVPAGLYTLFLFNSRNGPQLIINKQVGQWGTVYDAARDLVRIPLTMSPTPDHVEELTINIRQAAPSRGSLELAWGPQMATANFTVK